MSPQSTAKLAAAKKAAWSLASSVAAVLGPVGCHCATAPTNVVSVATLSAPPSCSVALQKPQLQRTRISLALKPGF